MTIPGIIAILSGAATAPMCASTSYLNAALVQAGASLQIVRDLSRNTKIRAMVSRSDEPWGPNNTTITAAYIHYAPLETTSDTFSPAWVYNMKFMEKFAIDVFADPAAFDDAFRTAYHRIGLRTKETPAWILTAYDNLRCAAPVMMESNSVNDMTAWMPNRWLLLAGERSGLPADWFKIEQMMTGAFPWSKKPQITMFINCNGTRGSGKSKAQSWFTALTGHIQGTTSPSFFFKK